MDGFNYRQTRNSYENQEKWIFPGVGEYQIPALQPSNDDADNWIGYNFARGCDEPEIHGLHFFIDDYQFFRLWTVPDMYYAQLSKFQALMTPDFSGYEDFPLAVQIMQHFRKHWMGAYWQMQGFNVIPTIGWGTAPTWDWCFDGEPEGSIVAVSSVGTQGNKDSRKIFIDGYREMMTRLQPTKIIFYGDVPDECTGNIRQIGCFSASLKARVREKRDGEARK